MTPPWYFHGDDRVLITYSGYLHLVFCSGFYTIYMGIYTHTYLYKLYPLLL